MNDELRTADGNESISGEAAVASGNRGSRFTSPGEDRGDHNRIHQIPTAVATYAERAFSKAKLVHVGLTSGLDKETVKKPAPNGQ